MPAGPRSCSGLYSRKAGWATNVIALFRITGAEIAFQPNWEVSAMCFADPLAPPEDTTPATVRRLEELAGRRPKAEQWEVFDPLLLRTRCPQAACVLRILPLHALRAEGEMTT